MAQIRLLAWNIQVYGMTKFEQTTNRHLIVQLIARTIARLDANMVLLMEIKDSLADQICGAIHNEVVAQTNRQWTYYTQSTVLTDEYEDPAEAYGIFWKQGVGVNFNITEHTPGFVNIALSDVDFPSNVSPRHGRRAAVATFRTTDTGVIFTASVYHAPPHPNQALQGPMPLARTRALYSVTINGAAQNVTGRLLAGDYNFAYVANNPHPEFLWLTLPPLVPPGPPPPAPNPPANGAGTVAIINSGAPAMNTHYMTIEQAVRAFGQDISQWPQDPVAYRDTSIDNIFRLSPNPAHRTTGQVIDLVADIMNPLAELGLRQIAQQFALRQHGQSAFPNADYIREPLNIQLTFARYAWILYRYAISDHLPVLITIVM